MSEKQQKITKISKLKQKEITFKFQDFDEFSLFTFTLNDIIEPHPRPRTSARGDIFYNPLDSYMKYFKRNVIQLMLNEGINIEDKDGPVSIDIEIHKTPPISWSIKKRLNCIRGLIKPTTKPDNDNYEKTVFDIFNKVLYNDDGQVYSNKTEKFYSIIEKTIINIKLYKNLVDDSGKMSKELKETLTQEELDFLYNKNNKE